MEYPNWVNTIAITRDGQFVLIRQYRHGIQETSYELCAGVCEKEDASPLISAQRELLEETGYGNGKWQEVKALLQQGNIRQALMAAPLWKYMAERGD